MKHRPLKKRFTARIILFILLCALLLNSASAIVIRHDVPDEKYQALGKEFSSFVDLANGCGGTLIQSNWVLTARHCTWKGPFHFMYLPRTVSVDGRGYSITNILPHKHADLALLKLDEHVLNVEPANLYKHSDEAGQIAILVGRGDTGNGLNGELVSDGLLRAARNQIEAVTLPQQSNSYVEDSAVLKFEMNEPSNALDLEGVGGPGDSGGPAYIVTEEGEFIAGVSSYGTWLYGDFDHYVRVSEYVDWIESTIIENK